MSYRNVDRWIVIAADGRNAATSFANHRARGSLGGVDCVAPTGTAVHAPTDGTAFIGNAGTGGRTVTLSRQTEWPEWRDQFMHLSEYAVANEQRVKQGDLLGFTGTSGVDKNNVLRDGFYDPHLHWHRVDPAGARTDAWGSTSRRNPWNYFTQAGPAMRGIARIDVEEDDMTPEQERMLKETWQMTGLVKQLMAETQQWKGIVVTLGEVWTNVAAIRALISETVQWEGMDSRLARAVKILEAQLERGPMLSETDRAALSTALSGRLQPMDVGDLEQIIESETGVSGAALQEVLRSDLAATRTDVLAAIASASDATLAAYGLRRTVD